MKKTYFILLISIVLSFSSRGQVQFKVYHGASGETQVYDNSDKQISKPIVRMRQGDVFTVKVINPNPILYNYTLKYETIVIESDDKAITDLLASFNTILSARAGAAFMARAAETNNYKTAVNTLITDINDAKDHIRKSDKPELPDEALKYLRTAGFRHALDEINSIPNSQFHLNNSNLLNDLNDLSDKAGVDDIEKQAFRLLNSSLVEKVNEIKKQTNLRTIQTIWQKDFKVSDSAKKILLVISKTDKDNNTLIRDGNGDKEFELELGTIIPYYKRSVLELVPVANFIFSKDVREFYLEKDIVQTRKKSKTTVSPGVILNANVARFGEEKEMAFGVGAGYKFNTSGDGFENFFLSTLFSYKNFFRIGLGFGFAQFPSEDLKNGGKVGQTLPSDISNLSDLIQYEEKPSVFLTIAFTGLNLTKKK
jgi:hypothetical protein